MTCYLTALAQESGLDLKSFYVEKNKIYINNVNDMLTQKPKASIHQISKLREKLRASSKVHYHTITDEDPNLVIVVVSK